MWSLCLSLDLVIFTIESFLQIPVVLDGKILWIWSIISMIHNISMLFRHNWLIPCRMRAFISVCLSSSRLSFTMLIISISSAGKRSQDVLAFYWSVMMMYYLINSISINSICSILSSSLWWTLNLDMLAELKLNDFTCWSLVLLILILNRAVSAFLYHAFRQLEWIILCRVSSTLAVEMLLKIEGSLASQVRIIGILRV